MAYIGMRHPVWAPISSHTDGSPITYGTGMVVGYGVGADLTIQTSDNKDYGDDMVVASDAGVNGLSLSFETNDLAKEVRVALLGYVADNGSGSTVVQYRVTGADSPKGGFGYIRIKEAAGSGTVSYEAFWIHKIKFQPSSEPARTKQENKEYQHLTLTGTAESAKIYSEGSDWYYWMEFTTETAAAAWLDGLANVPQTPATTT